MASATEAVAAAATAGAGAGDAEHAKKKARTLVGAANFVRHNPMSDLTEFRSFAAVEFWCGDAQNVSRRFMNGLGMRMVARSDMTTGNRECASYVLRSNDVLFTFTAPYGPGTFPGETSVNPVPAYDQEKAFRFFQTHGFAARAICIRVGDAEEAFRVSTAADAGGVPVLEPTTLTDGATGKSCVIAEIKAYGDVVLRFIGGEFDGPYLPNYEPVDSEADGLCYGLTRIDHIVGNVPSLFDVTDYLMKATGFHEFAEFTAEDVGTVNSGLNSMVLSNNSEMVLMPINEPTHGTARKSQIQTYIEQNNGPGVQHIALKTDDIFATMRQLHSCKHAGGFEFMPAPGHDYYERVPGRIGDDVLTADELQELEELGLLADADDQGVLLQVFTKPLGDRMTIFIEIIQRIGCDKDEAGRKVEQKAGCGGFGKGNFGELFKSIENYEEQMDESAARAAARVAESKEGERKDG